MKRRSNPVGKQGRSPYQKYEKRPHVYSAALNSWRNVIIKRKTATSKDGDSWHWRFGTGEGRTTGEYDG